MKYRLSKYTIKVDEDSENAILYNTFSGGIVKLSIKEYMEINSGSLDEQEITHFSGLKTQGLIVYEGTDEYLKMREVAKNIQQNDKIDTLSYVIAPTLNCNYN